MKDLKCIYKNYSYTFEGSLWHKPQVCDGWWVLSSAPALGGWGQCWVSAHLLPSGIFWSNRENEIHLKHNMIWERRESVFTWWCESMLNWFTEVGGQAEEVKLVETSSEPSCRIRVVWCVICCWIGLGRWMGGVHSHTEAVCLENGTWRKVTWHCPSVEFEGACGLVGEMGSGTGGCMSW